MAKTVSMEANVSRAATAGTLSFFYGLCFLAGEQQLGIPEAGDWGMGFLGLSSLGFFVAAWFQNRAHSK